MGLAPSGAEAIQLDFQAMLQNEGFADASRQQFVIGWQTAGGVEPVPFRVLIPAGCFVPNAGFHVEDFRGYGVQMALGRTPMAIMEFEARLVPRDDGSARLDLFALFSGTPDDNHPVILGVLGGSATQIVIGRESAIALPSSVETVGATTLDDGIVR